MVAVILFEAGLRIMKPVIDTIALKKATGAAALPLMCCSAQVEALKRFKPKWTPFDCDDSKLPKINNF
jgi:hypothetical protein